MDGSLTRGVQLWLTVVLLVLQCATSLVAASDGKLHCKHHLQGMMFTPLSILMILGTRVGYNKTGQNVKWIVIVQTPCSFNTPEVTF